MNISKKVIKLMEEVETEVQAAFVVDKDYDFLGRYIEKSESKDKLLAGAMFGMITWLRTGGDPDLYLALLHTVVRRHRDLCREEIHGEEEA